MRSSLGGDNLDTLEELAQKGIVPSGSFALGLGHHRNGSVKLTRYALMLGAHNFARVTLNYRRHARQIHIFTNDTEEGKPPVLPVLRAHSFGDINDDGVIVVP